MDVNTGAAALRPSSPDTQQDHQVTQSAILYLLQEATKLEPPVHGTCDHHATCLYNQPEGESEAEQRWSHTNSALSSSRSSSPWEVMSLINQQCARLLQSGESEEGGSTFLVSDGGDKDNPCRRGGAIGESGGGGDGGGGFSGGGGPGVFPEQWRRQYSITDSASDVNSNLKATPVLKRCEPLEKHTGATMCVSNKRLCVTEEIRKNSLVEENTRKEPCSEAKGELTFKHVPCASDDIFGPLSEKIALKSIEDEISAPHSMDTMAYLTSDPELKLDLNDNILCLTFDPLKDTQQKSPQQASLHFTSSLILSSDTGDTGDSTTLKQDGSVTASKPELLQSCLVEEDSASPAPQCPGPGATGRTKTPRKQPNPSRSADLSDPEFQGVAFRMHPELDDSREQCRLVITSKYSEGLSKSGRKVRKPRVRSRSCKSSLSTISSSEEESDVASLSKVCASCCTKTTPMWRDAEDGTPLCNACGIRYKKYRLRCVQCWHIPRKEGNSNSKCFKCGGLLTPSLRKNTA